MLCKGDSVYLYKETLVEERMSDWSYEKLTKLTNWICVTNLTKSDATTTAPKTSQYFDADKSSPVFEGKI